MGLEFRPEQDTEVFAYRERVSGALAEFLAANNLEFIVGISGGTETQSADNVTAMIADFIANIKDSRCAILTGGTKGGVPEIGIQIARASALPTVGVFPARGRKYALFDDLDLAIETLPPTIGEGDFGTETPTFVQLLDGAAVIGGSFGTLTEVATIMKVNNGRIKKGIQPIYLCPIQGTGGVADAIATMPGIDQLAPCLPDCAIRTGKQAALFLKSRLSSTGTTY
jgi:predicted Rossmann-fold nucleotide-binding protein